MFFTGANGGVDKLQILQEMRWFLDIFSRKPIGIWGALHCETPKCMSNTAEYVYEVPIERYLKQIAVLQKWSCFWIRSFSMNIRWEKKELQYYFNCLFVCSFVESQYNLYDISSDTYIYIICYVICIPYIYIFNILKLTPPFVSICSSLRTEVPIQSLRLRPISVGSSRNMFSTHDSRSQKITKVDTQMSQNAPGVNCKVSLHESSSGTWSADGGVEQFGHKEQTFHSGLFCLEWQHAGCSAGHDVRCEKNCQRISVSWSQNQNLPGQIIGLYRWIRGSRGYLSRLYFLSKWVFPKNRGTPKSSILIGFSTINHPFWGGSPYFWKHPNGLHWWKVVTSPIPSGSIQVQCFGAVNSGTGWIEWDPSHQHAIKKYLWCIS